MIRFLMEHPVLTPTARNGAFPRTGRESAFTWLHALLGAICLIALALAVLYLVLPRPIGLPFAGGRFRVMPVPGWSLAQGIDPQAELQLVNAPTGARLLLYSKLKEEGEGQIDPAGALDGALERLRAKGIHDLGSTREEMQVNGLRALRLSVWGDSKGEEFEGFFVAIDAPGRILLAIGFAPRGQPRARAELERMVLSIRSR